ncbi:MAG TPA: BCD family MFS transporter [Synechococcales cyanobacterium M55_K2018_004]|nr:BCD family MFS transporter [Synechococcales cyanobacterium M55_K2018_004]
MAKGDLINQSLPLSEPGQTARRLSLLTMFRLGLFQMGLGIMSLLTLGVLNRVMIKELAIPATIVAATIAMNQFVAPSRVVFGQMSDAKPLLGQHRTGYIWLGAALFVTASFLAVQVMWQLNASIQATGWGWVTYAWIALLALIFGLYGLAISASSTPFTALLVDVSDEDDRSKLVGIVWSMLMVGIIVGAIVTSVLLRTIESDAPLAVVQAAINRIFVIVPAIVLGLTILATVGVEKTYSRYGARSLLKDREDGITLRQSLKILTANRQTGIFFAFLIVMTLSLFLQEPVLEPFGGEVFGMTIAETTRLNAFWGTGTLLGLGTTGFLIVPRCGKQRTTRLGCLAVAASFVVIILAGFTANPKMLQSALLLFGLASGVTTTGAISLMLDLTAAETAGTFVGAWGLAQALSRAIATVTGGAALDLGRTLFQTPVLAYSFVFLLPIVGMLIAVRLLRRVNAQEFQLNAKEAIARVIQAELD